MKYETGRYLEHVVMDKCCRQIITDTGREEEEEEEMDPGWLLV